MRIRYVALLVALFITMVPLGAVTINPLNGSYWSSTAPLLGPSWDGNPPGTFVDLFGAGVGEYLVDAAGTSPGTFTISGGTFDFEMIPYEYGAFRDYNILLGQPGVGPASLIFAGSDGPGTVVTLSLPQTFELLLQSPEGSFGSSMSPGHFLAARGGSISGVRFGIEDLKFDGTNDRDFNDMIVDVNSVPEPGSISLLALGLLTLGYVGRRRKT